MSRSAAHFLICAAVALAIAACQGSDKDDPVRLEKEAAALAEQARELERQSKEVAAEAADRYEAAGSAFNGHALLAESAAAYTEAADLWSWLGDSGGEAGAVNQRGKAQRRLGRADLAEQDYRRAIELAVRAGDKRVLAAAQSNLGVLLQLSGQLEGARRAYQNALDTVEGVVGLEESKIFYLRNLAQLQMIFGNISEADLLLQRAMEVQEAAPGLPSGNTLSDFGWLLILKEDYASAIEVLEKVYRSGEKKKLESQSRLRLLTRLGIASQNLGRPGEARKYFEEALDEARERGQKDLEPGILTSLCQLHVQNPPASPEARDQICREMETLIPLADPNRQASAYHWLAEYLETRGRIDEALAAGTSSIDLLDSLRLRIQGARSRARFLEDRSELFRRQVEREMEAHRRNPGGGHDRKALAVSERLRARNLLEQWKKDGIDLLSDADPRLGEELDLLLDKLSALDGNGAPAEKAQAQAELDLLHRRLQDSSAGYRRMALPPRLDIEKLRQGLDENTAIVELLLSEPRSYLWIFGKYDFRSFELPRGEVLEAAADTYLRQLADPRVAAASPEFQSRGRQLARLLWGEKEERLAGLPERLVFVGDGGLQQFALAALPRLDASSGQTRYLLEDFEIVHLPALAVLDSEYSPPRESRPSRAALLLADPLYRLDPGSAMALQRLSEADLARLFPRSRPGFALGRLPYAGQEAALIRDRFDRRPIEVKTLAEASRRLALSPELADFAILHLTTHGWQNPSQHDLSAILLSDVDADGQPVDGRLRLQDIFGLRLRAELVVASACQTGVGSEFRFEGASGLAQGFLHAGARRALVSQWPVESQATARLMDHFYLHLLAGEPPGRALRAASLALIKDAAAERKAWGAPFYWAPFVLVGNWNSFEIPLAAPANEG